jgi:F-type H+-transporting ATPase subunit b
MEELVKTFHIEIGSVIAQLVNFAIVMAVLYIFAYKPILKTLNERTKKIEKGLKNAEEATNKMKEMEEKEKEILSEARKEAQKIINLAENNAEKSKEEISKKAKEEADRILSDAQKRIEDEKNKMLQEVKSEVAGLVISVTEKIIGEKIDQKKDNDLINKVIGK